MESNRSKLKSPRERELVRSDSATKIQSRVRGRQQRQQRQQRSSQRQQTQRQHQSKHHPVKIEAPNPESSSRTRKIGADPELEKLRHRVQFLQQEYRQHREKGDKGKMQLSLLDFDIANEELLRALAFREQATSRKRNKECNGLFAMLCLPCLLACQFCCCVSTGAVGERSKTVKERDETLGKIKALGVDFINQKTAPKGRRMQR